VQTLAYPFSHATFTLYVPSAVQIGCTAGSDDLRCRAVGR
jgi:hypothetical protein